MLNTVLQKSSIYIYENWKTVIFISIFSIVLIFIILFILWTIMSYYSIKWFKKNIRENYCFNNYTRKCVKTLKQYGDLPIKSIYLSRHPVNSYLLKLLNIITLGEYENKLKKYIQKNKCNNFYPFHTLFIIEVELPNKFRKLIVVEKNTCINISDKYKTYNHQDIIKIKTKYKNLTINSLLEKTKKRLGKIKYFNWHIYKNNCQCFAEEVLISLNKKRKKYMKFIYQNDFVNTYKTSDLKLHILNCGINLFNILEDFTNFHYIYQYYFSD